MRARLTIETGNAIPNELLLDGQGIVVLGRHKESHIILGNKHASRRHAEIYLENGSWFLRDCGGVNGTQVEGQKVEGFVPLSDGELIRIGDIALRFALEPSDNPTDEMPVPDGLTEEDNTPPPLNELSDPYPTPLEPDEMTALLGFMDASLRETTSGGIVSLALRTVYHRLRATIAGFLSLDQDDPLPKLVLPVKSKVNKHLSRKLTERVKQSGKTAWLSAAEGSDLQTDSLVAIQDAVVVPVQGVDVPLGALHVYRTGMNFSSREVRFCEALAGYLGRCLHLLRTQRTLEADNSRLRFHAATSNSDLLGDSPPMRLLKQQISKLSEGPKIVLIYGESGSGKELVALALHRQSRRHEGPLVPVNCAAITASMPESELFGHLKGSFTDAISDRPGYFAQADMGTLFLDEIGELSEDCQAKFLRVLEQGTFRPVGGAQEQKADVRIIAATNRDLKLECLEGRFRKDLFFRLGVEIKVPPLRERREDIPILAAHFLRGLKAEYRRQRVELSSEAMQRLMEYPWPGNVRQLRSVLEHAVAMCDGATIRADELSLYSETPLPAPDTHSLKLEDLEKWAIRQALDRTSGVKTQAAELLNINRDTLMKKMKLYGIEK